MGERGAWGGTDESWWGWGVAAVVAALGPKRERYKDVAQAQRRVLATEAKEDDADDQHGQSAEEKEGSGGGRIDRGAAGRRGPRRGVHGSDRAVIAAGRGLGAEKPVAGDSVDRGTDHVYGFNFRHVGSHIE